MEEYKFKIKTSVALLESIFLGFMYTLLFIDAERIQNIPLNPNLKIALLFLLFSTLLFIVTRRTSIIINKTGLSSHGVTLFSGFYANRSFKEVDWKKYKLIQIDKMEPSASIWHIGTGENMLHLLNTEKDKVTHRINLNYYQHINREKFETIYHSYGLDNLVITEDEYAKDYDVNTMDLGKRAGFLAYSSLGLVVIIVIISYFDTYKTIDFGYFNYVFIVFGLMVAFLSWKYLTKNEPMIETNWLVVALFSAITAVTAMFATLFVSIYFAKTEIQTYAFKKVNSSNEAYWENTESKHSFWCRVKDGFDKSDKKVIVLKSITVTRIEINEACPKIK